VAQVYDRFMKQRLSRRRLLVGAGGMALGAAALAACKSGNKVVGPTTPAAGVTGTPGPRPTQDESQVTKDGTYHGAFGGVLPSLSLFGATALYPSLAFGWYEFDHLFYVPSDTQKPEPMLALQWEQPDPQGLTTIFKMQPSVFHDMPPVNGRAVLARDVKASYEAFAADKLYSGREWHHTIMEAIEAPEDLTVIIRQKQP
jgi:ABC-type transport system substrate-binding protein